MSTEMINTQVRENARRISESIKAMEAEPVNAANGIDMDLKGEILQAISKPPSSLAERVNRGKTLDERTIDVNFGVDLVQRACEVIKIQIQNVLEQSAEFAEKCPKSGDLKELGKDIAEVQTVLKKSLENLNLTNFIDPTVNAIYAIDNLQGKFVGIMAVIEPASLKKSYNEIRTDVRNSRQWILERIKDSMVRGVRKINRAEIDQVL